MGFSRPHLSPVCEVSEAVQKADLPAASDGQCALPGRSGGGFDGNPLDPPHDVRFPQPTVRLQKLGDVQRIVLRGGPGGIVRLSDVATVKNGTMPQFFDVTAGGKEAVTVLVYQQPGSSMVAIAHNVAAALDNFAPQIPPNVTLSKWYDQSTLVVAAATSVRDAILIGIVLAAGVLMFFLRSWRITLLAMLIVPASLAAAVEALMKFKAVKPDPAANDVAAPPAGWDARPGSRCCGSPWPIFTCSRPPPGATRANTCAARWPVRPPGQIFSGTCMPSARRSSTGCTWYMAAWISSR